LSSRFRSILTNSNRTKFLWAGSLLTSIALLLLPIVFRLDGKQHSDWEQFLGRFHPLIIHIPIGLILLVPVLELAGLRRPALREAASFVLALSIYACLAAVALGYLLAYGSGDAGARVTRHMWGGIALTIAVILCSMARGFSATPSRNVPQPLYPTLLILVLLILSWTAHQGGSLTHGDTYLTEYLPAPLKHVSLLQTAQATTAPPNSFYSKHIYPVFDANCVVCHGESKVKGGLRLDSYGALMKGGRDGAVIMPGHPDKSLLLQRVTLPADHKQFMPADGKPPLKAADILLIKTWIAQGASPVAQSLAGVTVREEDAPPPPVGDYSRVKAAIAQAARSAGVTITPVSRNPADGLILNTIDASDKFTDALLTSFAPFAPYIVEVDLGRTSVTDACFGTLQKFTSLRALHLEDTAITGTGLQKLAALPHLTYLNLSGTRVTTDAVAPLRSMKQLVHVYLYNTPAQPVSGSSGSEQVARKLS
jgi:uncharacterized membrane protein